MAKADRKETVIPEGFSNVPPDAPPVPEGFEQVTAERVRKWFQKSGGTVLFGNLIGRFEGNNGAFYQMKLLAPCSVAEKVEGKKIESVAKIGEVVNVDGHKALEDTLRTLCDDGGDYEIYAKYGEKVTIEGGHHFWPVVVHKKVVKPPTRVSKGDVIPF